jgi:hypothetical protein
MEVVMRRRRAVEKGTVEALGITVGVAIMSDGERDPVVVVESPQRLRIDGMWAGAKLGEGAKNRTSIELSGNPLGEE